MPKKLSPTAVKHHLTKLHGWKLKNGKLFKELVLPDFPRAFGLMSSIAVVAGAMDHHPELYNVYNKVRIWLTTHDAGGISEKDITLAKRIDELLE